MKIRESAIWFDGKIYTGRRHSDIIREMVEDYKKIPPCSGFQGFVTEEGFFVDRQAGAKIAFEAGQIKKPIVVLFSEDLY